MFPVIKNSAIAGLSISVTFKLNLKNGGGKDDAIHAIERGVLGDRRSQT